MNSSDRNKVDLNRVISGMRGQAPTDEEMKQASDRAWTRLQSADAIETPALETIRGCDDIRALLPSYLGGRLPENRSLLVKNHLHECANCRQHAYGQEPMQRTDLTWNPLTPVRHAWSFGLPKFALAALVLTLAFSVYVAYSHYYGSLPGERAQLMSAEGAVYGISDQGEHQLKTGDYVGTGQFIRTAADSHAFLRLADGSVVEMNRRSQVGIDATRRNTTVHLDQGDIIVQAAKRNTGHLYVVTPDCRVAVTGTVFSVNSGTKGSRVSVIEGRVVVAEQSGDVVLQSGDQVVTSASLSEVPIDHEIAWSQNYHQHLQLMADFAKLRNTLEQIPEPAPRYDSQILPLLPKNTSFFLSIPNLGDTLAQGNEIFQQQLQQSPALQQWWAQQNKGRGGPSMDRVIAELQTLGKYLGNEIVIAADSQDLGPNSGPVLMAAVQSSGLKAFLQGEFAQLGMGQNGQPRLRVLTPQQLSQPVGTEHDLLVLVRPDFMVIATNLTTLQRMNAQLDAGASGFSETGLGTRIQSAYGRGAAFLLAADLREIVQHMPNARMEASGLQQMHYLIVEHRVMNGVPDNRAMLEFADQRRGIASWLGAPGPIRSLGFVSANAGFALSFISKDPAAIFDDIMSMTGNPVRSAEKLAKTESELNLKLRDDFAATLGGDMTVALDGPVLPKPSWKFVAEVYNAPRLQASIEQLVNDANREAAQHGHTSLKLEQENVSGQVYYRVQSLDGGQEADYTFSDGFMIVTPSRALLVEALQIHANGDTLARSARFQSLLPKDQHANFSGLFYQNLAPILQPLASHLNGSQMALLQELAAGSKPSVICAYGEQDRIELASNSRFPGLDLNSVMLMKLLGAEKRGTAP